MAMPWWGWVVLAGVLALAELHVPGSYLVWIALGAAVTGAVDAGFGLTLEGQLASFAAASAVSCIVGYFVYRRMRPREHGEIALNERGQALIGARGTVCEAIRNGSGKVRLADGVWLADGPDLAEGVPIVVSGMRGMRVVVQPAAPRRATDPAAASDG